MFKSCILSMILALFLRNSYCVDPFQNYTKEMKECYQKFITSFDSCKESAAKDWNCAISGDRTVQMSCGESEGRQCCPLWDLYDCQKKSINENCGPNLLSEFNQKVFDPQIEAIEKKDCRNYKHSTKRCELLYEFDRDLAVVPGVRPDDEPKATVDDRETDVISTTRKVTKKNEKEIGKRPRVTELPIQSGNQPQSKGVERNGLSYRWTSFLFLISLNMLFNILSIY